MILDVVRRSIGLKVSLMLAGVTIVTTTLVGVVITEGETKSLEALTISKAKISARVGALIYGRILEEGIDNNFLTVSDAFDTKYEEIKGYNWNGKPKYHTKYDFYTDRAMVSVLDRFLEGEDVFGALGSDVNGYIPTYATKFMQPVTGDKAKDLVGNRAKTVGNYEVAKKAGANEEPVLVQPYVRDTGDRMWDVSSPVYIKGKHWGAFRVLISVSEIERRRQSLVLTMAALFGAFALLSTGIIFLMIRRSLSPLVQLTALADELSTGERLEEPIKLGTMDEVGRMGKSLDRLRASLKSAMSRLGE
ncbi:MAG TPA: HAMP domain-containing protein [Polyangiaceae bacterium]|nr:HAMP domain-containing protein [Polyangiaceae bacterium]